MKTITISTPTLIMLIADIVWLIYAVTRDDSSGMLGSNRDWAEILWFFGSIIAWAIFGGIYWW